jgi:hypothetical protein
MILEQFNKLVENIRNSLERKLEVSRQTGKLYPAVTKKVIEKFQLLDGASTEEILSLMREVTNLAEHTNGTITHQTYETSAGRVGYYSHTNYYVAYASLIDEVDDNLVKETVQKALKNIIGLESWQYLDCRVMQLFKDGKIDWETVVKAHKEDCTL